MRRRLLAAAVLAGVGALIAPGIAGASAPADVHAKKVLQVDVQAQTTGYYCGPAATRIALSAKMGEPPSQDALAEQLGTTENGTDHIGLVTDVLNSNLGESKYESVQMPNEPPSQAEQDQLWEHIVADIDAGYPLVANIVAPPSNQPPGYPDETIYHYFAIIGYDAEAKTVTIGDPAGGTSGFEETPPQYELSIEQMARLIPPKGYSA